MRSIAPPDYRDVCRKAPRDPLGSPPPPDVGAEVAHALARGCHFEQADPVPPAADERPFCCCAS